ncbi:pyridoxal phosphate-dependent aminotransferase [bacterium]|nr:pyridoxal phosphate-dependent aminotransferase [bacterium]
MLNKNLNRIQPPPIVKLKNMAKPFMEDHDFIDLSQAVPSYPPPDVIIESIKQKLNDLGSHIYTPDPGRLDFREALCEKFKKKNNISTKVENIIVTAGANQAYLMTLMTFLNPGDEVILLTPYYFNHHMSVCAVGGIPVEIELDSEKKFQLDIDQIQSRITSRTKAITIVTPSNPTGVVITEIELRKLAEVIKERDIMIISDETYEYFTPETGHEKHFSIGSIPEISDKVITIGSFSKTYSLTGWRVGYLHADQKYIDEMLKIQDIMVICAPNIAQQAALVGIQQSGDWLKEKKVNILEKICWLKKYEFSNPGFLLVSCGAFFAYVKHDFDLDSFEICEKLLNQKKLLCIPGEVSGKSQKKFFRIAIGGIDLKQLQTAFSRINEFIEP